MKKLVFALLGAVSLNVSAVNPTQGPLQQDPSLCSYGYNPNCGQNNRASAPPKKIIRHVTVNVPSKYGALARDNKGVIGGSANENSLNEARKAALQRCLGGGKNKNCKIITWVRNGCFAVAEGRNGKGWMLYDVVGELGETENKAMSRCTSKSLECRITVPETCSIP